MKPMFEVDPEGLAALVTRRGYAWAGHELLQNALDTDAQTVSLEVTPEPGRPMIWLICEDDDPAGFGDRLHHAWTLFAPSHKRDQAQLRGRFNAGEKLVLALCEQATIHTTSGTVTFSREGREVFPRRKRAQGTRVECLLRVAHRHAPEILDGLRSALIPERVTVTVNGEPLTYRPPLICFDATLPTEALGADDRLIRTRRKTQVRIVPVAGPEQPMLYELGIPVVEAPAGLPWHVDVSQKVPLGLERDSVSPAYRRQLSAVVLNHTAQLLDGDQTAEAWVSEAIEQPAVDDDAVRRVLDQRYGAQRVVYDPSDPEANSLAASRGFTVIPGRAFSKAAWTQVRRAGAAAPAGQVTPSPKPFHPDGTPLSLLDPDQYSPQVAHVVAYCSWLAGKLLERPLDVMVSDDRDWQFAAACGPGGQLYLSLPRLGASWFASVGAHTDELLIHEYGHAMPGGQDHLAATYHRNLTKLGAKLAELALSETELMRQMRG
jgi:hypothetical protein